MPSRVMQAKLKKMRDGKKKAYLNKPRSGGVDFGKIAAHEMFQNKPRVSSVIRRPENSTLPRLSHTDYLPDLNNTWMGPKPKTMSYHKYIERRKHYLEFVAAYTIPLKEENAATLKDRKKIIEQVKEEEKNDLLKIMFDVWQGVRHQGVSRYHKITMGVYDVYFSGEKFRFVVEDDVNRYISYEYRGRSAVLEAYNQAKIKWETTRAK